MERASFASQRQIKGKSSAVWRRVIISQVHVDFQVLVLSISSWSLRTAGRGKKREDYAAQPDQPHTFSLFSSIRHISASDHLPALGWHRELRAVAGANLPCQQTNKQTKRERKSAGQHPSCLCSTSDSSASAPGAAGLRLVLHPPPPRPLSRTRLRVKLLYVCGSFRGCWCLQGCRGGRGTTEPGSASPRLERTPGSPPAVNCPWHREGS